MPNSKNYNANSSTSEDVITKKTVAKEGASAVNMEANAVVYYATVVDINPQTFQILINTGGTGSVNALMLTAYMTSLLGVNDFCFPQIGSEVVVLRNLSENKGLDLVLGAKADFLKTPAFSLISNHIGVATGSSYTGLQETKRIESQTEKLSNNPGGYPIDIVDGERCIRNAYGIGMDILSNLIRIKGSDLAKIECFVLDDLVRILSHNFEHITSFGDFKIVNNKGALDVYWKGTSNEYESFGLSDPDESKHINVSALNAVDCDMKDLKEAFYSDAKWRFSTYIGKIGNFIHTFICDPKEILNVSSEDFPTGRFNCHVNQDGSFLMQSVGEIAFEKVVRIVVPIEKLRPEEVGEEIQKNTTYLDACKEWEPSAGEPLFSALYKLNDYSKWFANYFSLAAFYVQDRFKLPSSENEIDAPSANIANGINNNQKNFDLFISKYACLRIFRDGSLLGLDGYGSSISLAGGRVTVSAASDLNLEAANSINLNARNINILARDSISLSAIKRGICIRAKGWLEMVCTKGAILLQSLKLKDEKEADGSVATEKLSNSEKCGVIIKSDNADVSIYSKYSDIVMNSMNLFLKCRNILSSTYSFIIKNIVKFTLASTDIATGQLRCNSLYTVSISNATAGMTATGQVGLTAKHDRGELLPNVAITDADSEKELNNASRGNKANFKYPYDDESNLIPANTIYRSNTQNVISDSSVTSIYTGLENDNQYNSSKLYETFMFQNDVDYLGNVAGYKIGFPAYPGDPTVTKYYTFDAVNKDLGKPSTLPLNNLSVKNPMEKDTLSFTYTKKQSK